MLLVVVYLLWFVDLVFGRCSLCVVFVCIVVVASVSFVSCCRLGLTCRRLVFIVLCASSFVLGCFLSSALLYFRFGACCPLHVVCCMLLVVCCLLFVLHGLVFDVRCLSRVVVGCQLRGWL